MLRLSGLFHGRPRQGILVGILLALGLTSTGNAASRGTSLLEFGRVRTTLDLQFRYQQYESDRENHHLDRWSRGFSEGLRLQVPGSTR